jgi:hypothetical protein
MGHAYWQFGAAMRGIDLGIVARDTIPISVHTL